MLTVRESCNMHIFRDMKINSEYSKFLKDMNKVYSQTGIKTLIHSLKHQRIFVEEDNITSSPARKEKPSEEFNALAIEKMLKRIKDKVITKNYIKLPVNERTILNLEKRRKNQLEDNREASFSKYRPNFNSIRKKVRTIDFSKEMPRRTIFSSLVSPNSSSLFGSFSLSKQKSEGGDDLPQLPMSFSSDCLYRKDSNKAMRFSKYTWRKESKPKFRPNESMRNNCTLMSNLITKGCFEFNKMKTSSHLPLSKTTNGPTIGMYNPNYSSIYEKTPKVTFAFPKRKQRNKQFLIKKIWKNYEVSNGYQLVDLPSKS